MIATGTMLDDVPLGSVPLGSLAGNAIGRCESYKTLAVSPIDLDLVFFDKPHCAHSVFANHMPAVGARANEQRFLFGRHRTCAVLNQRIADKAADLFRSATASHRFFSHGVGEVISSRLPASDRNRPRLAGTCVGRRVWYILRYR